MLQRMHAKGPMFDIWLLQIGLGDLPPKSWTSAASQCLNDTEPNGSVAWLSISQLPSYVP